LTNRPAGPERLESPYLGNQLIAYIGNKRRLLPFIKNAFDSIAERVPVSAFIDPFAGTGAVSRLARFLGWRVAANDAEEYSRILCSCYLTLNAGDLEGAFKKHGGTAAVFRYLNSFHPSRSRAEGSDRAARNENAYPRIGQDAPYLPSFEPYISAHYAPRDTDTADYRSERLFYTAENAVFIDLIRSLIEEWYPAGKLTDTEEAERVILLTALLYEASVHSNTSGVFKAFHKGFGGHGKDALSRIMSAMELEMPSLIEGRTRAEVFKLDAAEFAASRSCDLCYLDPPYNQHQYGSNYHMLNTIAFWDKPPVSGERTASGAFAEKAAIPKAWKRTRSDFCYARSAPDALSRLLAEIDARMIVLSYNTEGIIPFDRLIEICSTRGSVEILGSDYVTYRGGRQSNTRRVRNVEFLVLIDGKAKPRRSERGRIDAFLLHRRLVALMASAFHPDLIKSRFETDGDGILVDRGREKMVLRMSEFHRFVNPEASAAAIEINPRRSGDFMRVLADCACLSMKDEMDVILDLLRKGAPASPELESRFLKCLMKIAFKKYAADFSRYLEAAASLASADPGAHPRLILGLPAAKERARLRMDG
jgi:adenine-specific DNA-methyltransferase